MAKNKQYPICGLAEKLKELCYKNDIPACKLGQIAGGYERKTVYGWLHGDTVINSLALAKICAYFHVSSDWLLGLEKVGE